MRSSCAWTTRRPHRRLRQRRLERIGAEQLQRLAGRRGVEHLECFDMGIPAPLPELAEHHFGVRFVVRRADMVGLSRHGLHPAAHFGGVQRCVELPFNLRRRRLCGLRVNRACAEGGSEHDGTGKRVAHETSPPTAIGTPPSCDRMRSILERIAIDWNHKCRWSNARLCATSERQWWARFALRQGR